MSEQLFWLMSLLVGFLAILCLLLQLVWEQLGSTFRLRKQIRQRLNPPAVKSENAQVAIDLGPLDHLLVRAGIHWSTSKVSGVLAIMIGFVVAIVVFRGWVEALVAVFFLATGVVTLWRLMYEKQRRQIFAELPVIVDSVIRSLSAGRSVEQGLAIAFGDASPVFNPLVFRLKSAIAQGRDYTNILDGFAALYNIPSITQVALALRTSARFGSSVRPVLLEVSKAIRARQELRQEFMAATAETRFTAMVFALMPPAMAVYIVLMNEDFAETLLNTGTGHTMLVIAGVLQLLGSALIWNLIRGVGRG